jgi:predicted RecA/RadA family phage recombinase
MKRFIPVFALCIVVGALLACGESNTGTKAGTNDTGTQATTAPAQHFKTGDAVKVGDIWQVTVNSVKTDTGGQYSSLKSGDVYLLVDVSMNNISSKEQTTSSLLDWTLKGTDGQKYSDSFFSGAPSAPEGKVEAGSPAKGTLAYEIPSSVHELRLAFAPSVFSGGQTIWDLTV